MQRAPRPPRNRQPRLPRSNNNNHASSRPSNLNHPSSSTGQTPRISYPSSVPSISQVVPHARVSIVLKADQGTGREVQGAVADVLTRGNHPRGIKVRLMDGRVGRVQRMVEGLDGAAGEGGEILGGREVGMGGSGGIMGGGRDERERILDVDSDVVPQGGYSLEDFLPRGHPLREDAPAEEVETGSERREEAMIQKCPLCGEFEGDGKAVEHHVNAVHFED